MRSVVLREKFSFKEGSFFFFLDSTLFGKTQKLTANSQHPTSFPLKKAIPQRHKTYGLGITHHPQVLYLGNSGPDSQASRPEALRQQRNQKESLPSETMNLSHSSPPLTHSLPGPQLKQRTMHEYLTHTRTHTELPFCPRAAESLPGRTTSNTSQGLVMQSAGWNSLRLVKIQRENISPSPHSQTSHI